MIKAIAGSSNGPAKFKKMFLYILQNKRNKYYVGITALTPEQRLKRHNNGDVFSTKIGKPWKIIHEEEFTDLKLAREREKQIKSWHGGNALKSLLARSAGSSNGRTMDSESINLGSNPSPADLARNKNLAG